MHSKAPLLIRTGGRRLRKKSGAGSPDTARAKLHLRREKCIFAAINVHLRRKQIIFAARRSEQRIVRSSATPLGAGRERGRDAREEGRERPLSPPQPAGRLAGCTAGSGEDS